MVCRNFEICYVVITTKPKSYAMSQLQVSCNYEILCRNYKIVYVVITTYEFFGCIVITT